MIFLLKIDFLSKKIVFFILMHTFLISIFGHNRQLNTGKDPNNHVMIKRANLTHRFSDLLIKNSSNFDMHSYLQKHKIQGIYCMKYDI